MQRAYTSILVAAIVTAAAGQALAADTADITVSTEQVKAELAEARRTGNIVDPESGVKLNQAFPARYPAQVVAQGKTREQVKAELADAKRFGDIVDPETQLKLNQVYPGRYPTRAAVEAQAQAQAGTAVEQAALTATAAGHRAR